jgi:hypothetical protein
LVFITGGDAGFDCLSSAAVSSELDSTRLSLLLTNESLLLLEREIGVLMDNAPIWYSFMNEFCGKPVKKVAIVDATFNVLWALLLIRDW